MKKQFYYCLLFIAASFCMFSCKKYLDAKPDKTLSTISSVEGLQGFLDDYTLMNQNCTPAGEAASDNYYLTDIQFEALSTDQEREAYLWGVGSFTLDMYADWQYEYNIVYLANLALDGLTKIEKTVKNETAWDYCKGSALVYRAKSFFEIAQVWALAYDSATAKKDLGIPLRLTSDFNVPSRRANNEDTYSQIIEDLKTSLPYLPDLSDNVFRPSKAAAYGLLSRTLLAMRKYQQAKLYSDSCLMIRDKILDFNTLDTTSNSPFGPVRYTNPEDIMHSSPLSFSATILRHSNVDSLLYQSYTENDLRKIVFFKMNADETHSFKAEYENAGRPYNGVATDEIYLNRAECLARLGNVTGAMNDLNKLLINRWKTGTFNPYTVNTPEEALNIILTERRKELFYRMLRFTDIKRLNKEGANIVLKRIINGQTHILPPNDSRYARPIPDRVIELSGMQQNN